MGFADTLLRETQAVSKEEGRVEGYNEATRNHVRNMQKEGFPIEIIARIVKKPVETVQSMML